MKTVSPKTLKIQQMFPAKPISEIAREVGLSRQRVHQIVRGYRPPYHRKTVTLFPELDRKLIRPGHTGRERTRELVRIRDGYKCQSCEAQQKEGSKSLDVHHLGGLCGKRSTKYDKISMIPKLITLCHKCHFNHPEHTLNRRKAR